MLLTSKDGMLVLVSERFEDNKTLLKVYEGNTLASRFGPRLPAGKPIEKNGHKKHQFKKICEVCGRVCHGKIGLGTHMSMHRKNGESPTRIPVTTG